MSPSLKKIPYAKSVFTRNEQDTITEHENNFFDEYGMKITNIVVNAKINKFLKEDDLRQIAKTFYNVTYRQVSHKNQPTGKRGAAWDDEATTPPPAVAAAAAARKPFNAVVWHIRNPVLAVFIIHQKGEIILTGCKNEYTIKKLMKMLIMELRRTFKQKIVLSKLEVTNIIALYNFGSPINVYRLLSHLPPHKTFFEPEQQAGLTYFFKSKLKDEEDAGAEVPPPPPPTKSGPPAVSDKKLAKMKRKKYTNFQIYTSGKVNIMGANSYDRVYEAKQHIDLLLNSLKKLNHI